MQLVELDLDDWEQAVSRFVVPEESLITIVNKRLAAEGLSCSVAALTYGDAPGRNWSVARFTAGHDTGVRQRRQLERIAGVVRDVASLYDVAWPSVRLH